MKKKIFAIFLLVALAFSMVACGTTPSNNDDGKATWEVPEEGFDMDAEITITFSHTMGQSLRNVLDLYIEKFNEIYPNITIEHSQIGGYDEVRDQTNKQLSANNQPNIAYCYPDHVALYNVTKKVIPLDSLINCEIEIEGLDGEIIGLTEEQKADFIESFYKEGAVFDEAGTMYTMPLSKSTEVIFYNKTFFDNCQKIYTDDYEVDMNGNYVLDEAGNKKPNPNKGNEIYNIFVPTTWDEMETVCARIQEILKSDDNPNNDKDYPLGYDSESNWFITMTEQYGSPYTSNDRNDHFLFNNKTNREFVKKFREWYQKGYVTTQELYGSYTSGLFTNTDPESQSCYMCIGSTGGASHQIPVGEDDKFPFEVGIAPIPQVDPENPKVISQGPSLCIFSQVGDKDSYDDQQEVLASWLFVKYLCTTPEFQAAFSKTSGYMPVIESAKEVKSYKNWLENADGAGNLAATVIKLAFDQADAAFVSPAFNGSTKARDQVGELIKYCFVQKTDDVDAMILDAFKKAINECLAGK